MTSSFQGEEDIDPRAQERVGTVLDEKWTLESILGSGGMGVVYAGRHRNGARGAVKVLHPELARRADVRERFLREGYAANRVGHRGAVQVLDDDVIKDGPDDGTAYLVMEMLEGESLEDRMEKGLPIGEAELLRILDAVLAVLVEAHANGVVHRDLKPANLWLNAAPTGHPVKVLDFGLARLDEGFSVTRHGIPLGTPSFMAPEQALGEKDRIDGRTDLFALGATAFMILANRGVHEAEGVIELVARMGTMAAPKLREVAPLVGEPMARIVDRALEFERADRYPDANAMRADVAAAQGEADQSSTATTLIGAPSVPPPASAAASIAAEETAPQGMSIPPPSTSPSSMAPARSVARRGSRVLVGLGVFGLLAAGAAVVLVPRLERARRASAALSALMTTDANESPTPVAIEIDASVATLASDPLDASADAADASDEDEEDDDDDDAGAAAASSVSPPVVAGAAPKALASSHPVAKHLPGKPVPAKGKTTKKKKKKKRQ